MADNVQNGSSGSDKEVRRLEVLRNSGLLDSEEEELFNEFVRRANEICETPTSLISLVEEDRQWFKARIGFNLPETSREVSFCAHAIQQEGIMEVPDTFCDARFFCNALVTGAPFIRFYAGVPLSVSSGEKLGTLCVIDSKPRKLKESQKQNLAALAKQLMTVIDLRRRGRPSSTRQDGHEVLQAPDKE